MATISYPPGTAASANGHAIFLNDTFRDLLAAALAMRHRAQIRGQPELMLLRSTWDASEWAQAEADTLLAYLRAVLDQRARHDGPR
jgi:hypothetical protein